MSDFIKKHFVSVAVPLVPAFSYLITVYFYFLQYIYYGIPLTAFSPTVSQIATVMFLVMAGLLIAIIVFFFAFKMKPTSIKKKSKRRVVLFSIIIIVLLLVLNITFNSPSLIILAYGACGFLWCYFYFIKEMKSQMAYIFVAISLFVFIFAFLTNIDYVLLNNKSSFLKMKESNYLLVHSSTERDVYKKYDFEKEVFIDDYRFIPSDMAIELEKVKTKK